ncbi:MAG TPA: hypothetical protein VHO90_11925 [Bacteroidales bacterium]|nr:hypothetical protein [Bacteroidales bacterium]
MKRVLSISMVLVAFVCTINAATKTSLKASDLLPAISNDIAKNYTGYAIKEAFKVDTKGVITYEVLIQKGKDQLTLFYRENGTFIRKAPVASVQKKDASQNGVNKNIKK